MRGAAIVPQVITRPHADGHVNTYKVREILGKGGFGTVFKVIDLDSNDVYALKVTPRASLNKPKLIQKHRSEVKIQSGLNHPNICRSYDYFEDRTNTYILLEYCPNKSVKDLLKQKKRLSEEETAKILRDVVDGLNYLHDNRIIHRDIKLENFLIGHDGKIKIADFGLSAQLNYDDEKKFTACGTPNYISPEILASGHKGHSYEVDIWAIGVCAFAMLTGHPPFETRNTKLTYEHIKTCNYCFPFDLRLSYVAKDFVHSTLQIRPELRPNAQELTLHAFLSVGLPKPVEEEEKEKEKRKVIYPYFPKEVPAPVQQLQILRDTINQNVPYDQKRYLSKNRRTENVNDNAVHNDLAEMPKYGVARFCDHSEKYGLGYLLLDGTIGACFNDSTRMVLDPHEHFIQYWSAYHEKAPIILRKDDQEESKKIYILLKFAESLKRAINMYVLPDHPYNPDQQITHVKYWIRTTEATLFRMNNRTIQVNFSDKKKLIIYWNEKKLMLLSSFREQKKLLPIHNIASDPLYQEENRRFLIAKTLLEEMNER